MQMKKDGNLRLVVSLGTICIIAGLLLAVMNSLTAGPIAEGAQRARVVAVAEVLPKFDNNPLECLTVVRVGEDSAVVFPGKMGDRLTGIAVEITAVNSFSGQIRLMIGFDVEGRVADYNVLEQSETPGLGAKVGEWFREGGSRGIMGRMPAEEPLQVIKDGGEIDGITAATITSRSFLNAVNRAAVIAQKYLEEQK